MRVKLVLDTNTIVSAFFWQGNEAELFRLIDDGKATMFISEEIMQEVRDVINRPKFNEVMMKARIKPEQIMKKINSISKQVIGSKLKITVCRDEKDNKFLECAMHAKADFIVSGDKDLLVLNEYKGIKIVRTKDILGIIDKYKYRQHD